MLTETSGYCFLKCAKTSGRMCRHVPSFAPTTISPRGTRSVSAIATVAALRASSVSSANFRNNLPDAVSETFPPERSSSLAPTSSSMERICEEIAGWVRKRFSAAREKLDRRETSINVSSWSKSIKNQASGFGLRFLAFVSCALRVRFHQLQSKNSFPEAQSQEPEFIRPIKTINFLVPRWRNRLIAPALFERL